MRSNWRQTLAISAAVLTMTASSAFAGGPPVQATLELPMTDDGADIGRASSKLDGGNARVHVRVANRDDDRTTVVTIRFRYRIPPDTIAFDEIIDHIQIETLSDQGDPLGTVDIDPHEVNLNPNGPRLVYQMAMYRGDAGYLARVRVSGNYE